MEKVTVAAPQTKKAVPIIGTIGATVGLIVFPTQNNPPVIRHVPNIAGITRYSTDSAVSLFLVIGETMASMTMTVMAATIPPMIAVR